jgi:protein-glutamine gamma-glutamyltransferase
MSFSRLQKVVTYLLAALGLTSITFGGEVPLPVLLGLALGFVASWFAEEPLLSRPWWSKSITAAIAVLLVGQIARGFVSGGWLGLAMEFAGLLSISRLANRRNAADYQQIAILAFIQLIAATVLTTDFGYAGVFVAFAVVTPWVLTFAHLRREIERNYPVETDVAGGNDLKRVLASRRIVDLKFLLWTAMLSVPMLLMTVTLFAFFPRIGLGMLSVGAHRGEHVSGFGGDIELGGFGLIRDDPTVVVRVSVPSGVSPDATRRMLRLRGTAFDQYDGRKWTRSKGESVRMSPMGEYYPLKRMEYPGDLTLKLVLDRLDEPVLFVPTGTVGLRIPQRGVPGAQRTPLTVTRHHGFDLRYRGSEELGVVYEAVVNPQRGQTDVPVDRELDEDRYLGLPPGHERVIALAQKLTSNITDPLTKARRLDYYLRAERRYAYSLQLADMQGKVPIDSFLFEVKRGHCEYFSTALAIMLRAVGIPSRNVSGFAGGEFNSYGGYYAVRQADAHSWVEALLPGRGWVMFDPTPASRDAFSPSSMLRELRAMVDAMRAYWMTRVVGYDLRTQVRALRDLRDFFRSLSGPADDSSASDGEPRDKPDWAMLQRAWPLLAGGILLLAVIGYLVLRKRGRARADRSLSASARRAQQLYRELEQTLAQRGLARPAHVTPEAHARALSDASVAGAAAVLTLTEAYLRTRYGAEELSPSKVSELRQLLREVKQQHAPRAA